MANKLKHRQRSRRSHRKYIPQFPQSFSRKLLKESFKRNNISFSDWVATMFALFRGHNNRKGK
ncbi:hypothetical protein [Herbinix hemicellulosilytica]|uniref:hypothetical protein n=1 Tax=Herbinix hemicellulosilytica TaxID=1564487 RepID=UPI0013050079|nr:hypothetical protein [Herbinix hemicellulosilytica]